MSRVNLIEFGQKCNDHFPDAGKMVTHTQPPLPVARRRIGLVRESLKLILLRSLYLRAPS